MDYYNSYKSGNDRKYVLKLKDGALVETALFEHRDAIHFCVPTQVGCNMGCKHCSTTYSSLPYIRDLSSTELIEMIKLMKEQLWNGTLPMVLSFSGHGEPMMNWDNVQKCAHKFCNEFSSIYTTSIGLIDTMDRILLKSDFHPDIYFSIHGSSDRERAQLMPSVKSRGIANLQQIIDFGRVYIQQGGRVVWNYMICSTNASEASLQHLLMLCSSIDYPIELRFTKYIDIHKDNEIKEVGDSTIRVFYEKMLEKVCPNIHIRISQLEGEEMGIACGQMRACMQAIDKVR